MRCGRWWGVVAGFFGGRGRDGWVGGGDSTASFSSLFIDRMSVTFPGCLCGSPENEAINSFN